MRRLIVFQVGRESLEEIVTFECWLSATLLFGFIQETHGFCALDPFCPGYQLQLGPRSAVSAEEVSRRET